MSRAYEECLQRRDTVVRQIPCTETVVKQAVKVWQRMAD